MHRIVLTDTNAIFGRITRDYLLYAHAENVIGVRWSKGILDELETNLALRGRPQPKLRDNMLKHMPESLVVVTGGHMAVFDDLTLPDPDDAHVMAAALAAEADILCSNDAKHFPRGAMERTGAVQMTVDETLSLMVREYPTDMRRVHRRVVHMNKRLTEDQILDKLRSADCRVAAQDLSAVLDGMHFVRSSTSESGSVDGYWRHNPSH